MCLTSRRTALDVITVEESGACDGMATKTLLAG